LKKLYIKFQLSIGRISDLHNFFYSLDIEVALTDLREITTRELVKNHKPYGLDENRKVAKMGGYATKVARKDIEKNLGESVVIKKNVLNYK